MLLFIYLFCNKVSARCQLLLQYGHKVSNEVKSARFGWFYTKKARWVSEFLLQCFSLFTSVQTTIPLSVSVCLRSHPAMLDSFSLLIYNSRMNWTLFASTSVLLMTTLLMSSSVAHRMGVTDGGACMWVQVRKSGIRAIPSPCSLNIYLKLLIIYYLYLS